MQIFVAVKKFSFINSDYVGCYVDQWKRTLGVKKTSSISMTVEQCKKTCLKADTQYYGLEVTVYKKAHLFIDIRKCNASTVFE